MNKLSSRNNNLGLLNKDRPTSTALGAQIVEKIYGMAPSVALKPSPTVAEILTGV